MEIQNITLPKRRRTEQKELQEPKDMNDKKKLKPQNEEQEAVDGGGGGSGGVPTEDEVEEFYAILRRMKVAVKYFDDKGKGRRQWREALENADDLTAVHGAADEGPDDNNNKKKEFAFINEGFDLNAVAPEAAESGGS
ncbi:hypothetical protein PIB30_041045 [Stylosanthes scabra]|uniref:Uncharacterized protein n=1 Tax=Stylosanthes scabra TaxID=79078 RepID=A0ABU6SF35_9FABA|nr:hypothetical protein [Stylosanthes scabra]